MGMGNEPHQILYELVAQHNEALDRMEKSYLNMVATVHEHERHNAACRERLLNMVPNGDADAHRRWHEADIKRMAARAALLQDLQKSVAKWGLLAILGWAIASLWHEGLIAIKAALTSVK